MHLTKCDTIFCQLIDFLSVLQRPLPYLWRPAISSLAQAKSPVEAFGPTVHRSHRFLIESFSARGFRRRILLVVERSLGQLRFVRQAYRRALPTNNRVCGHLNRRRIRRSCARRLARLATQVRHTRSTPRRISIHQRRFFDAVSESIAT